MYFIKNKVIFNNYKIIKYIDKFKCFLINLYEKYKSEKNKRYWKSLKGKYNNQIGFVIGNGPSLKINDLTEIYKGKYISIASNKIYLAFNQTLWRPTIYTVTDGLIWTNINNKLDKFFNVIHINKNLNNKKNTILTRYWTSLPPFSFSSDISKGINGGYSVTFENLQIAIYMGLNPIYLIGCDHSYVNDKNDVSGEVECNSDIDKNHFILNYTEKGEIVDYAPIDKVTKSFLIAREYAENNEIQVFNATRGGKLEVFPRIKFDEIMK